MNYAPDMRAHAAPLLLALSVPLLVQAPPSGPLDHGVNGTFNRALGVECTHCHTADQWTTATKPAFNTARKMLEMVSVLNVKLDEPGRISCMMCHGGQLRPSRQPRAALNEQLAKWPPELTHAAESQKLGMAVYNVALGVGCGHCHTADWKAADKAPMRKVALMNALFEEFPKYMPSAARTQCFMCHKGSTRPAAR